MVEYHGWFTIIQSLTGESEDDINNTVNEVKAHIDSIVSRNQIMTLKPINGQYFLQVAGSANHRSEDVDEIFDLIEFVSSVAQGSYGVLYIRDDEDTEGRTNEFMVYKMARGKITLEKDMLLSPCEPVIEE